MKIETPDSGFLTDAMVFEPDTTLSAATFCDPKLEVELAFHIAHDLEGDDLSIDDVLNATAYVTPALELIAARSHRRDPENGRARTVFDTISDNAANAGITTTDTRVGDFDVPVATGIFLNFASANRDSDIWSNPDSFNIHRPNANRHISFGKGVHHCLGAEFTRFETALMLEVLAERLPSLRLTSFASPPKAPGQQTSVRFDPCLPLHVNK